MVLRFLRQTTDEVQQKEVDIFVKILFSPNFFIFPQILKSEFERSWV
jgi:hypothetical protein